MKNKKRLLFDCVDSYNKCTNDWIDKFYSRDLEWIAMPSASVPKGRKGGFNEFYQFANNALNFFKDRKLKVLRSFVDDNTVILEQEWSATLPQDIGSMKKGEITKQMIISIFEVDHDLIAQQTDYMVLTLE